MQLALLTLLLSVPCPPPASVASPAATPPAARADLDLKGELDRSVRWLRSTQDPVTGSYGGSLEPTAWALIALARCPRHYAPFDGPFVKEAVDYLLEQCQDDGSVHEEGASDDQKVHQTLLAATVFAEQATPETTRALAAAIRWLDGRGIMAGTRESDPTYDAEVAGLTGEDATAYSVRTLAQRDADGSWPAKGDEAELGRVQKTAQAIVRLSWCYEVLKAPKTARSATALPASEAADRAAIDASVLAGARFLLGSADARGLWGAPDRADPGITAMVLAALQAVPEPRPDAVQKSIDEGLAWLAGLQHEDGSIHDGRLHNYVTSAAILALARSGEKYRGEVVRARDYLVRLQSDEGEGYSTDHHYYGGVGYGGDERPDLSNLQMALEAMAASGLESDHEAYQRALTFLQRCQNRSESNDLALDDGSAILVSGEDGGSAYAPGSSPAGYVELEDGRKVARSYGSMSYALLKSYIFAGLERDDPRVEALWEWLQANYTLDVNPGFQYVDDPTAAYQGLFYYFNTMARALDLYGAEEITDALGTTHRWRAELAGRLIAMQSRVDGSWENGNAPRWWEGNPVLATAYALTTLELTRPRE